MQIKSTQELFGKISIYPRLQLFDAREFFRISKA